MALAPDAGQCIDTRGLCGALAGQLAEALADFQALLAWADQQANLDAEAATQLQHQCQQRQT